MQNRYTSKETKQYKNCTHQKKGIRAIFRPWLQTAVADVPQENGLQLKVYIEKEWGQVIGITIGEAGFIRVSPNGNRYGPKQEQAGEFKQMLDSLKDQGIKFRKP